MWVPVARGGPEPPTRLLLRSPDGALTDVTDKNVVVDLHPLLWGVYFEDPSGHLLEIITRPYGSEVSRHRRAEIYG